MSERGGDNLPELHYFLNNGRDDVTRQELTELHAVVGKATFADGVRRGGDGATFPSVEFNSVLEGTDEAGMPVPFSGYGEGASLEDQGLKGTVERAEVSAQTMPEEAEAEERPSCEGRTRRPWESSDWDGFDDDQPDYPDDREYL